MVVSDRQRHVVLEWAKRVADEEVAEALMELLPPVGWADVPTKRDLDHAMSQLRSDVRADVGDVRADLKDDLLGMERDLRGIERAMRLQLYWIVGSIWSVVGLAWATFAR